MGSRQKDDGRQYMRDNAGEHNYWKNDGEGVKLENLCANYPETF